MSKQSWNSHLKKAKSGKKDEFYTQLADIERELGHYKEHFQWKTVFCNCDDPRVSNFFHYFSYNFEHLWLKKLITTCYKNNQPELFSDNTSEQAIYLEYFGDKNGDHIPNPEEIWIKALKWDGDFRSPECIELLKEADIVVTNPPFSLFREYVAQLMKYDKKFIILWNMNAITYKEIFKLIKENKFWSWYGFNMSLIYKSPYENNLEANRKFVSGKWYNPDEFIKVPAVNWFTNLEIQKRHEDLVLYKTYKWNEEYYPNYENYDAINIDKVTDIPMDYVWLMWVPITFLDKYSPEQFEIIGLSRYIKTHWMSKKFVDDYYKSWQTWAISEGHPDLCYYDKLWKPVVPYMRMIIKNKKLSS